jgi:polysaccharide biosynthesis protein PslE
MSLVEANIVPQTFALSSILPMVRRGWPLALLVFAGVVLGVYGALMYSTEQYEANARLLVRLGRENAQVPITVDKGSVLTTGVQKEEINSYIQVITSRSLLIDTVRALGAERFDFAPAPPETLFQYAKYYLKAALRWFKTQLHELLIMLDLRKRLGKEDQAVKLLEKSLSVERDRDSNVISISLRLPHGELALETVQALVERYLEHHVGMQRDGDMQSIFGEQTDDYRAELAALEAEIERVKREWNVYEVAQQRAGMITRLETVTQALRTKESQLARLEGERAVVAAQLDALPRTRISASVIEPNPSVQQIKDRLVELRLKHVNMSNLYKDGSDALDLLKREIAELSALLEAESDTKQGEITYSPLEQRDQLEQLRAAMQREEAGLRSQIDLDRKSLADVNTALERLNQGEALLRMLELDHEVIGQKYKANAARREEARISEVLSRQRVANVGVLHPPSLSPEPVSPRKMLIMAVGSAMGLLFGIGVALLREWSRDIVYSPRDLAGLAGVRVLGDFHCTASA